MISDPELRGLFKSESEERLQGLDENLLRLEKNPDDPPALQEAFRAAHSLKGSAHMIGLPSIKTIAHHFESILDEARNGSGRLSVDIVNRLYAGLDAIRKLVHEAVTGEAANVNLDSVLAQLNNSLPPAPLPAPSPTPDMAPLAPPFHVGPQAASLDAGQPTPTGFKIETIRVKPSQIDKLMTLAGELTVAGIQSVGRARELEDLLESWEVWSRELLRQKPSSSPLAPAHRSGQSVEMYEQSRIGVEGGIAVLGRLLAKAHEDNSRLEFVAAEIERSVRSIRLLPLSTVFNLFPRMVRDLAQNQGKEVELVIEGGDITADKLIIEEMKDPIMHLLRNAIGHGIESPDERKRQGKRLPATVTLRARQTTTAVELEVRDDGQGLNVDAIRKTALQHGVCQADELATMKPDQIHALIFRPGFSTASFVTDVSGRGVGLDVVRSNVERLKGTLLIDSKPGEGCAFSIQLPITLAMGHMLIVQAEGQTFAIPVEFVEQCRWIALSEIYLLEGQQTVTVEGRPVSVIDLSKLLGIKVAPAGDAKSAQAETPVSRPCVFLELGANRCGVFVDVLLDEQEVVEKPLNHFLARVRNVLGSTILDDGRVCMILNPHDLLATLRKREVTPSLPLSETTAVRRQALLLVEDSLTTRTQLKRILEGAHYEVATAVDGLDGWNQLVAGQFDAVVSDIQMPNLDGFDLTARIRKDKRFAELPVILVTSLSAESDRRRGLEVGANAYLAKPAFDQKSFIDILRRLV
ncbi:MAG: hybrid sensor histidine kinase/response regulator [bacterium]